MHEALRQRISVQSNLEGLTRDELDGYLTLHLKAAMVSQSLFDKTARPGDVSGHKGHSAQSQQARHDGVATCRGAKSQTVNESILLDATAEALL